jgi:hypothetical protein
MAPANGLAVMPFEFVRRTVAIEEVSQRSAHRSRLEKRDPVDPGSASLLLRSADAAEMRVGGVDESNSAFRGGNNSGCDGQRIKVILADSINHVFQRGHTRRR